MSDELVTLLTAYARRDSALYGDRPPGVPLALWRAYGDRYPGGPKRVAEARAARDSLRRRRRRRRCEKCGSMYGPPQHRGVRFCSWACYLVSLRPRRPVVVPDVQQVQDEMRAALAALDEAVGQ